MEFSVSTSNKNHVYKKSKCISATINSTEKTTILHILINFWESLAQLGRHCLFWRYHQLAKHTKHTHLELVSGIGVRCILISTKMFGIQHEIIDMIAAVPHHAYLYRFCIDKIKLVGKLPELAASKQTGEWLGTHKKRLLNYHQKQK